MRDFLLKIMATIDKISIAVPGGTCSLLLVAFIVLKLCNVITWSWIWVLAPIWLPIVIAIGIIIVLVSVFALAYILSR